MELKTVRKRKGLTLEELAAKAGVGKSTLSRLERSACVPSYATVLAIEQALGLKRGTLRFGPVEHVGA